MSHIFPLVSGIHTSTLTAGLPWTGIRDVVFPGFRICCCYARVQVCRETKKSSDCWRSRRCKMPLSYLLSQQQLVNAHASQPSTKQTINRKWCLLTALLTPSVPFSKCQSTCSPPLSPACFLPSGERGSSSIYFAAQLKSPQSVQIEAKG